MNAVIKAELTERERAEVRQRAFREKRLDYLFMIEVLQETSGWHVAYSNYDALNMEREMDKALWAHMERTGLFEEAEQEILSSKSINGRRYLEA